MAKTIWKNLLLEYNQLDLPDIEDTFNNMAPSAITSSLTRRARRF